MEKKCNICGKKYSGFSWSTTCYFCRKKEYQSKIVEQISNGELTRTDREEDIYCPYCGEVYEIEDEYYLYEDGDHELVCMECEREFTVSTSVSYSFSTSRQ